MDKYNLKDLVYALGSPISEDQVWALCFKTTKEMRMFYNEIRRQPMVYEPPNLGSVIFSSDGDIFSLTVTSESKTVAVDLEKTRQEMVCEIGQLLLEAMRVTGREELSATSTLQALLLRMIGDVHNRPSFKDILSACRREVKLNANIHYDLVVKDMIFHYVYGDKINPKTGIEVNKNNNNMEKMARINSEVLPSHLQHPDVEGVSVKTKPETQARQEVQPQKNSNGETKETFLRNLIKKIVDEALEAAVTSFTMHTASREYYVKIMGETVANESLVQVTQYLNSAGDTAEGDNERRVLAVKLLLEALEKALEYNSSCDYSKLNHQLEKNMDRKLNRVTIPIQEFHETAKLGKESGSPCLYTDTIDHRESGTPSVVSEDAIVDKLTTETENGALQINYISASPEVMKYNAIAEELVADVVNSALLEDDCLSEEDEEVNKDSCIEDEEIIQEISSLKVEDVMENYELGMGDICTKKDEERVEDVCSAKDETHDNVKEDVCYDDVYVDDVVGMAVYMLHCY